MKSLFFLIFRCLLLLISISQSGHSYRYEEPYKEREFDQQQVGSVDSIGLSEIEDGPIWRKLLNVASQSNEDVSEGTQRQIRSHCFSHSQCDRRYEHCSLHGYCTRNCKRRRRDIDNDNLLDMEENDEDEYERNSRSCRSIRELRNGLCYDSRHCGCNRICNTCTHRCQYRDNKKH